MANRPKGYGFSREVADRMQSKYSEQDECEIVEWICHLAGVEPPEMDPATGTYGRAVSFAIHGSGLLSGIKVATPGVTSENVALKFPKN